MKRRRMPEAHVTHPNVTPLIDVVMCLIVFYMLVAKIGIMTGADAKIDLPVSLQGVNLKDLGNTVTLNVSAAGEQPMVTTLVKREDGSGSDVQEVKIIDGARRPLETFLKLARGSNENFKVIIRADQDLDYRYLEPVLIVCANVRVKDVNFATRKPQG